MVLVASTPLWRGSDLLDSPQWVDEGSGGKLEEDPYMASTTFRKLLTLASVALVAVAMTATAAFAQDYPPSPTFGVTCTPQNPTPGQTVTCEVVGAQPAEVLSASATQGGTTFFSDDNVVADAEGNASFSFTVPGEGAVTVTVSGPESGTATTTVLAASATADDDGEAVAAPAPRLPMTGGQVLVLTAVGFAMLAGGLLALRRREDAKVSATA